MRRTRRATIAAALIATVGAVAAVPAGPARADTIHAVTTTDDVVADDGELSLREAFDAANADADVSVIELEPGAVYVLDICTVVIDHASNASGALVHVGPDDLVVAGNGATIQQTCPGERVMRHADPSSSIELDDLTLTGGTVTEIDQGPEFEPTGGGGGLRSDGPATLVDVVLSGNTSVESGGALRAVVAATIVGGTITGNTASTGAGGIDVGSGIDPFPTFLTMNGTTITMNDPTAIVTRYGTNSVTDADIVDNRGDGIFADHGDHVVTGSTVADNDGGGIVAIDGGFDIVDSTVSGNDEEGVSTTGFGDFTVTGGSITENGSHGIDFIGCNASEGKDNIVLDAASVTANGGWGINHAGCGNSVVTGSDISGNDGGVRCSQCESVLIEFSTIAGNSPGGGVDVRPGFDGFGGPIVVRASQVTGNFADDDGGGIRARAGFGGVDTSLTVSESSTVSDNSTSGRGGGIYAEGDTIVFGSVVSGNSTSAPSPESGGEGGGIHVSGGDLSVTGGAVQGNTAEDHGGGISHRGAGGHSAAVFQTEITENDSLGVGGGVFAWSTDSLSIVGAVVSENTSVAQGGGIGALDSGVLVALSTIDGNQASAVGGGIYDRDSVLPGDPLVVGSTTISDNTAPGGGGVFADIRSPAGVEIVNSTITGNSDDGVRTALTTPITLDSSTIVENAPSNVVTDVGALLTSTQSVIALGQGGSDCVVSLATSNGYNVSGDGTCGFGAGVGDVSFGGDPALGPLQDNGGPTFTREPVAGSPLLSMVPSGECARPEDQRGETRPGGTGCEPGAVEVGIALGLPDELTTLPGAPAEIDVIGQLPPAVFDVRSLTVVEPARLGTARAADGSIVYEPALGASGTDRFSYEICRLADTSRCERATVEAEVTTDAIERCTIVGTDRRDVLIGTPGDDVICALDGRDLVFASGGDDLVLGGVDGDVLIGGRGFDQLLGGDGRDLCIVGADSGETAQCERPRRRP